MIKFQEIYEVYEGLESCNRRVAIKILVSKGFSESTATKLYNIWRRHYMESSSEE